MHFSVRAINLIQLKNDYTEVPEAQHYVNLNPELACLPFFFFYNDEQNVISIVMVIYLFIHLLCLTFIAMNIEAANTISQASYFFVIIKK